MIAKTLLAACVFLTLIPSPAYATENCTDLLTQLRTVTLKYRAAMAEQRTVQTTAERFADNAENRMRAHRQFALANRDVRARRDAMLKVYRSLIGAECDRFDESGFEQTVRDFKKLEDEELAVLHTLTARTLTDR